MKMRSLAIKLTFAFLLISILGTATVALLVNWQTRRQFDDLVNELYLEDLQTAQERLATIYATRGNWQGVENSFYGEQTVGTAPDGRPPRRLPITLVNSERMVIIGNHHLQPGEILPAAIVEQGLPIEVDGATVGWVMLDSFGEEGDFSDSPEAKFLASLNSATVWSALGTALVGLLAGVLLARTISHPISELQDATEQMARGKLGTQVAVRSNDEVGRLAASFNQMSADLARANEVRRQMTADIAHDLRTPLSVIQGYTEALDDGKLPGNSEIYGAMHKQVKHLNRLVEDLRTLSLADAGQLSLHPQSVQPRDLLEHTLLLYAPQAEQKKINLGLQLPPADLPAVTMDLDRMVQVLGNLISNAIRHTPAGGAIQLAAQPDPRGVQIAVTDSGAGINPEDLPHVFDRFYRGNKARSDSGESGLGLAIARSIVAAHGGQIA
ncbi:MAG: HAMP domain-containing protein, partial [Anaerolineales bacterium]|nr:HAMP domain-containing protein [Anaerolineales bacterium]